MKYVFVLEEDERFQREIFEALFQIDPKLQVRFFLDLKSFSEFIQKLVQDGPQIVHRMGAQCAIDKQPANPESTESPQMALLICHEELLGTHGIQLLEKTKDLFLRKKITSQEEPLGIVLTAFDRPEFKLRAAEQSFVNNVIYKPFDHLILQQHLSMALLGRKPAKSSVVHTVKTSVKIEMIKSVDTESFSDIGFITCSPQEVSVGQIAKYYGDLFISAKRNYVYARCWKCEKHPEIANSFRCWFTFFGTEPASHADFRRKLSLSKAPEVKVIKTPDPVEPMTAVLVEPNDARRKDFKSYIEKNLKNTKVVDFNSWDQFILKVDPQAVEAEQKVPAWAGDDPLTLNMDISGHQVLSVEPALTATATFLGLNFEELQKTDFNKLVTETSSVNWMKMFVQKKAPEGIDGLIQLHSPHGYFLVKCIFVSELKDEQNQVSGIKFVLQKPTIIEKNQWYDLNLSFKEPVHCIFCPYEFIHAYSKEIWDRVIKTLEAKLKGKPVVIAKSDEIVDETKYKELPRWVQDVVYVQPDRVQMLRKLSLFLQRPFDENFKFFALNQEIRIAQPIELLELSEAGLVIKYYRALELGSYRKFVLPKATGESVLEYLATCNYTEPDANDKAIHYNHFIFFGITDAFLKNIRVWMRDNYAQEKEKESAAG